MYIFVSALFASRCPAVSEWNMKNQFYVNCSPLEVIYFKQIKSCLSTEKCHVIHICQCPLLPHEVKAVLGLFCLYWNTIS